MDFKNPYVAADGKGGFIVSEPQEINIKDIRKEIDINSSTADLLVLMSEGNPGAISVLMELINRYKGFVCIFNLDDMNIRGTQIWTGYKDHCNQDMDKFEKCAFNRDTNMIETINNEGKKGNYIHKAVKKGASKFRDFL